MVMQTRCGASLLRFRGRSFCRRMAVAMMMAAAVAFALQCMFVASSEAATGDSSHYYLGFVFSHHNDGRHSHLVTHKHADGIVHHHEVDDDNDALVKHVKGLGWNMALVTGILPCPEAATISETPGQKLTIEKPGRLQIADLIRLRKPPRTPCIA